MTDPARPLVTLFVMAYRQEGFVAEAIEAAFAQTYEPLEIILSDDNSPDGTFRIMEEMAAAYDGPHRVRLNRNPENLGLVRHIDRIMELATGELIVQNAGDDVSRPDRAARLAEAWLASGREAKAIFSGAEDIDEAGRSLGVWRGDGETIARAGVMDVASGRCFVVGAVMAWDREVFDCFGPLGPGLTVEDTIIPFRAALLGRLAHVDEPLIRKRGGGLSAEETPTGRDFLYGARVKKFAWRLEHYARMAAVDPDFDYPERAEVERLCAEEAAHFGLVLDLARASYAGRLALAPRALALSVSQRSLLPAKILLQYLFDGTFMRRWDRRHGAG